MKRTNIGTPRKIGPFEYWGIHLAHESGDEWIGECPKCKSIDSQTGKGHLYVNSKTGAFYCQMGRCDFEGGQHALFSYLYEKYKVVSDKRLLMLTEKRGIPLPTLKTHGVAKADNKFFLPAYDQDGKICNLRTYILGKKENSTKGVDAQGLIFGNYLHDGKRVNEPVYVCGSMLDALSLTWLLERNKEPGIAVATPGEKTFRDEWIELFIGRDVRIIYDHDVDGYGQFDRETNKASGMWKVYIKVVNVAKNVYFVHWPDKCKKGFDVNDFIQNAKEDPKRALCDFRGYLHRNHKYDTQGDGDNGQITVNPSIRTIESGSITLDDIYEKAKGHIKLTRDLRNAIKLSLATVISTPIPGPDNVWLFLVGPSGTGKTLSLQMLENSRKCSFQSSFSSKALVSGYNLGKSSIDPSILATINSKCLVLKDFTEILGKSDIERNEVFDILRGAYDGSVVRSFGNGTRRYLNLKFSLVGGVTEMIKAYQTSEFGNRFIHYEFSELPTQEEKEEIQIKTAEAQLFGRDSITELQQLANAFMHQNFDYSPESLAGRIPNWFTQKIVPLANLVANIRTTIPRHKFGFNAGQVLFKPKPEQPNRLTAQFQRLGLALSLTDNTPQITEEHYKLIKQIGLDTAASKICDITKCLAGANGKGLTKQAIKERVTIVSHSDWEDIQLLGLVSYDNKRYTLTKKARELWSRSI